MSKFQRLRLGLRLVADAMMWLECDPVWHVLLTELVFDDLV